MWNDISNSAKLAKQTAKANTMLNNLTGRLSGNSSDKKQEEQQNSAKSLAERMAAMPREAIQNSKEAYQRRREREKEFQRKKVPKRPKKILSNPTMGTKSKCNDTNAKQNLEGPGIFARLGNGIREQTNKIAEARANNNAGGGNNGEKSSNWWSK
eukprot:CAMPEP_0178965694 /NCGR_PEP_ID=MMETSP0789-20121207/16471_1 /TAXON_ID=3005 /ORGANISM="Rhizosolenia setigera, Strain CCMP 1694" /LENGTH=154 /DNA_ID=CAMNT_0020650801 /DNA_START=54 /DNA_END=519 /DNA_ORIENTATION=+